MNNISIPREVVEKVRDALKALREYDIAQSVALMVLEKALEPTSTECEVQPEQCWCETCRPIASDVRMVLCPDCGNKRCPKANDHRNDCTNRNAVGQQGSSWEHVTPVVQPEPEQEPVAHFGSAYVNENGVHITTVLGPVAIPQDAKLYTTPPKRQPLTLNEMSAIEEKVYMQTIHKGKPSFEYAHALIRATEAAHGIKE